RTVLLCHVGELEAARSEYRRHVAELSRLSPVGARPRLLELAIFAQVASLLGEADGTEPVLEELRTWAGLHVYVSASLYLGPASLYIGMLERLAGRWDEAELHLRAAIERSDADGTTPFGGLARAELLCTLTGRGSAADASNVDRLQRELDALADDHSLAGI